MSDPFPKTQLVEHNRFMWDSPGHSSYQKLHTDKFTVAKTMEKQEKTLKAGCLLMLGKLLVKKIKP